MLSFKKFKHIYFYRPVVDFRKGIGGLVGIVEETMKLSPFENHLFLFCNRNKNRLKALYWDETGFALWYKVLEEEKFKWPFHLDRDVLKIDVRKLEDLLIGLNPWQIPHKIPNYTMT